MKKGFLYAALRVFDLSLSEMLWSRRTVFMVLVTGIPVILALIVRGADFLGASSWRVNNTAMNGSGIFAMMIWAFYLRFTIPVLGAFYGTALIADEVEDKTITFLFTRPISRGAVLFGKYLAYLACTMLVVLPSVALVWLLVAPLGGGSLGSTFLDLAKDLPILAAGLAVYGALFALVGASFKRPLLTGLIFVFGFEPAVLIFPGYLKNLTVAYYLQGLVPQAMPNDLAGLVQQIFREVPGFGTSVIALLVITIGGLWLAARTVTNKEYILEQ